MWKIQHCVGNGYIKKMVMKGTLNCKELESYKVCYLLLEIQVGMIRFL